jgi:hypothetical protein
MKPCCTENVDRPIRKGRAHYICPVCGQDITIMLTLIGMAESEEVERERKK